MWRRHRTPRPALPRLPGVADVALPDQLGFAAAASLPRLSQVGGVPEPVRAVLMRVAGHGLYHAVLYVPGRPGGEYVEVDQSTSAPLTGPDGSLGPVPVGSDHQRRPARPGPGPAGEGPHPRRARRTRADLAGRRPPDLRRVGARRRHGHRVERDACVERQHGHRRAGPPAHDHSAPRGRPRSPRPPPAPVLRSMRADGTVGDERPVPGPGRHVVAGDGVEPRGLGRLRRLLRHRRSPPWRAATRGCMPCSSTSCPMPGCSRRRRRAGPQGSLVARGWAPQDVLLYTSTSG